jgi:hypothetical protein
MEEVDIDLLQQAVESQYGGNARFIGVQRVTETFGGTSAWDGYVHLFNLEGNAKATKAYAWSSPVEGSDQRQFYAVLHLGAIRSPHDAVRAAIVAERRHEQG